MHINTSIENSIELLNEYPSVVERYFTLRYCTKVGEQDIEHHCVMFHSNRICLISLADEHPIIKHQKSIKSIDCQVSTKVNRLDNKVSGKGKKGGQHLEPNSILCKIECEDGSVYNIYSCIKGKLVEINDNLSTDSSLLLTKPKSDGFIAIVLPQLSSIDKYKDEMLSLEQYQDFIK
ncbi:protein Abitram [Chrysoperla carnea]|uniref:protein Abitram n=1 Tax=Chrysoperla carnea TaxID=189513 RepID=UPI001D071288|nr:protein Abitram [Chrysoperla carnea]